MRNCALILAATAVLSLVYCDVYVEHKFLSGKFFLLIFRHTGNDFCSNRNVVPVSFFHFDCTALWSAFECRKTERGCDILNRDVYVYIGV